MLQYKTCFKCGKNLPIDDFYCHSAMKDGHLNKCKNCTKKDVKKHRYQHKEYYDLYEKYRQTTTERKKWKINYQKKERIEQPQKYKSRTAVSNALRDKRLFRQPCEICGSMENIQAHHEDYSKPLDVIWLCFKHHRWIHS